MRKHLIGIFKTSFDRIYPVKLLYFIFIINKIRFSQKKKKESRNDTPCKDINVL